MQEVYRVQQRFRSS